MTPEALIQVQTTRGPVRVVDARSAVSTLVTRRAVAVHERCSMGQAVETMRTGSVSALLVGARAGIVTERDLARGLAAGHSQEDPVDLVATPHPVAVAGGTSVVECAGLMLNEQLRHLLVDLDDGTKGIVSMRDLLAVLLQADDSHLWLTSLRVAIETPAETWLG